MIERFFHAINELIFYELDGLERSGKMRRRERILPFYRDKRHGKQHIHFDFNAEDFLNNKFFKVKDILDAYGTVDYVVDDIIVRLLNTYGDEDTAVTERFTRRSIYVSVFPICVIYNNQVEFADIVTDRSLLPRKKLKIVNRMVGDIPKELMGISFSEKRAFYFYKKEKFVSLRVPADIYPNIPEEFIHKEAEEWASSPRVKIGVKAFKK